MGYLVPVEMFDNMLQLMRFSVYFQGVLNANNGYFHIKIMIFHMHTCDGARGNVPSKKIKKKNWWGLMFLCILY